MSMGAAARCLWERLLGVERTVVEDVVFDEDDASWVSARSPEQLRKGHFSGLGGNARVHSPCDHRRSASSLTRGVR